MKTRALKLDRLIQSAQTARTKTIAIGVRAWGWLRGRARKNSRIQTTFHQAAGTTRNVLRGPILLANRKLGGLLGYAKQGMPERTVDAPLRPADVTRGVARRDYGDALAGAMAEMMARVHAEQQAIQCKSQRFDANADSGAQARPGPLPAPVMGFVSCIPRLETLPSSLASPAAQKPQETVRSPADSAPPDAVVDTRPLAASRAWRPGGVRYLRRGVLSYYARRALVIDPQCRGAGRGPNAGESDDAEASSFPLQWQQTRQPDGSPRAIKDRAVNGRHSPRKPRASRR